MRFVSAMFLPELQEMLEMHHHTLHSLVPALASLADVCDGVQLTSPFVFSMTISYQGKQRHDA